VVAIAASSCTANKAIAKPPRPKGGLFSVCLDASECADGYACSCDGVCSVPCSRGPDTCGALDAGAACSQGVWLGCDFGGGPSCLRGCANDDACRLLGEQARCLGGSCKIPQPADDVDGSTPTCEERFAPINTQVDAAVASADRSCRVDGDCVNASASNSCYGTDCPLLYLSKKGSDHLEALLASLEARSCDAIFRAGCGVRRGQHGCPLILSPACLNGTCRPSPVVDNFSLCLAPELIPRVVAAKADPPCDVTFNPGERFVVLSWTEELDGPPPTIVCHVTLTLSDGAHEDTFVDTGHLPTSCDSNGFAVDGSIFSPVDGGTG
jgi:hypothetical protein